MTRIAGKSAFLEMEWNGMHGAAVAGHAVRLRRDDGVAARRVVLLATFVGNSQSCRENVQAFGRCFGFGISYEGG